MRKELGMRLDVKSFSLKGAIYKVASLEAGDIRFAFATAVAGAEVLARVRERGLENDDVEIARVDLEIQTALPTSNDLDEVIVEHKIESESVM
ncbi:MAG TPA: hypothetical protein VJI73_01730 [Candidatus Paceibacterota bacterium]